eukprot:1443126-Rhodomonas_salina.2
MPLSVRGGRFCPDHVRPTPPKYAKSVPHAASHTRAQYCTPHPIRELSTARRMGARRHTLCQYRTPPSTRLSTIRDVSTTHRLEVRRALAPCATEVPSTTRQYWTWRSSVIGGSGGAP